MKTKTFEVRDRGTFIPVLATQLDPDCEQSRWLLARSGFGKDAEAQRSCVLVTNLNEPRETDHDVYSWTDRRTMHTAHKYITTQFDVLQSGSVIDVEYLLGESGSPKTSEAFS